LVWHSPAAHRALLHYLAAYDRAGSVTFNALPPDDPLFASVQEPRELGTRALDGTWLRLVDLQQALEGRGYAAEGFVSFALEDGLCPWNSGVWRLSVEGDSGRLRRWDGEPDLTLAPRALAMPDALFRGEYAPFCMDHF